MISVFQENRKRAVKPKVSWNREIVYIRVGISGKNIKAKEKNQYTQS